MSSSEPNSHTNAQWVERNLQRQRKMLEDKQRQKRFQVGGGVRANPTFGQSPSFMSDYSLYSSSSGNASMPFAIEPERITPTVVTIQSTIPRLEPPPRHVPVSKSLIDFENESELSDKLNKADLSKCVASDDEDDEDSASMVKDHWSEGIEEHTLPCEKLPDIAEIEKDKARFVEEPAARNTIYKCSITRDKRGMDKGMYPTYYLHLEYHINEERKRCFLLAARKRKKSTTANYLISSDPLDLSREGENYIAKVRSNALGTQFTLYDRGHNPRKTHDTLAIRQELAAVVYETNVLGFKGPRKMTILVPGLLENVKLIPSEQEPFVRKSIRPIVDRDTLVERHRLRNLGDLVVLNNKNPVWNEDTQSYVLNFHGRVTQASVKNFQIIHENDPDYIIMQFGRVSDEHFSMDFRYPLSALQAFGIAMTSFHGKLACE
ncbi:unnamed protein product [Caenorhabditis angaria]|uniref:Tubby-like protein n=1 Tax=Caenorhabditis angaria TaxID=860376 RepID=A0A9P1I845_9PELO|nr:unnamed protein product [Caenorhabditis angaria]